MYRVTIQYDAAATSNESLQDDACVVNSLLYLCPFVYSEIQGNNLQSVSACNMEELSIADLMSALQTTQQKSSVVRTLLPISTSIQSHIPT